MMIVTTAGTARVISAVSHNGLMMFHRFRSMFRVPTGTAIILEAKLITTKVRSLTKTAVRAQRVLQVRINLNLFRKFGSFDFNESCADCLHVGMIVVENHTTRANRIFVLVRVNTGVNDSFEEILENIGQTFGAKHSMKCPHEHGFVRIHP